SADAGSGDGDPNPLRNSFEWESRSVGAEWRRQVGSLTLLVTAWDARAEAEAEWLGEAGSQRLGSARGDQGLWWALERRIGQGVSLIGIRAERSATDYRVDSLGSPPSGGRSARNSVVTAVIAHSFGLPSGFSARVGGDLAAGAGTIRAGPQAELTWRRSDRLSFGARYARTHQFAQSLRNPESVAGNIFLPDLYFGAGSEGVPVARSDLAVLRADHRPSTGVRITLQAYARRFLGLLLAAPRTAEPYSTGAFDTGRGTASGVSVEATMSRAHFGVLAGYGLERLRILPAGAGYVPGHGASHRAEGGIIVLPGGGTSIRLGAVAALGRRATGVVGDFEWEACNLVDGGCEFRGSPRADSALGAVALPAYFRVDLGVRQSVQLRIAGREASVALFGTLTNLLGRRNVLTYSEDPDLGVRAPVEMRPRSPLVVGLDWRF
ncbi:MAG TPA: hypothetical protein VJ817_03405, partial [Gemmatimonadales bacterium]|nr:hypothetical protein [Gemmatimonadales bacterium]